MDRHIKLSNEDKEWYQNKYQEILRAIYLIVPENLRTKSFAADFVGVSRAMFYRYLNGSSRMSPKTAKKIGRRFGFDPRDLSPELNKQLTKLELLKEARRLKNEVSSARKTDLSVPQPRRDDWFGRERIGHDAQ